MAKYYYESNLKKSLYSTDFNTEFKTSQHVEYSGIYRCKTCGYEIALNAHEGKVPPHQNNSSCSSNVFKLLVKTDN